MLADMLQVQFKSDLQDLPKDLVYHTCAMPVSKLLFSAQVEQFESAPPPPNKNTNSNRTHSGCCCVGSNTKGAPPPPFLWTPK